MTAIPVVELRGAAASIGRQHGETLKREIGETIDVYRGLLQLADGEADAAAAHFERLIRTRTPDLAEEIDAIAHAAGAPRTWLYLINARSEVMSRAVAECTAVYSPDTTVLAQNWDWDSAFEDLAVVLDIRRSDGHRIVTLTEPGIVGKIGMNSAGLGVCLNFMTAPGALRGLPIHVVLRQALEMKRLDEVTMLMSGVGGGRAGNILVGTDTGAGLDVEFVGEEARRHAIDATFVHTNHPLDAPPSNDALYVNSAARLEQAQQWAASATKLCENEAMRLLGDRSHDTHPICVSYLPQMGMNIGTLCAVVMNLRERRFSTRKGPDPTVAFTSLAVD